MENLNEPITTQAETAATPAAPAPETPTTQTPEPTPTNRDFSADIAIDTARSPSSIRTTRQFDLANGTRLVDMRPSGGLLEIIPEGPGVNFRDVPSMSRNDAVLAVLDDDMRTDAERLELIQQITNAPGADIATR